MKFNTVADAFNHYRNSSLEEIETRATQLKNIVETDANADIASINIEIEGLAQAKANLIEKDDKKMEQRSNFNPITGTDFNKKQIKAEDIFASTEYRNAFYKTMLGQDLTDAETQAYSHAMNVQALERRTDAFNTTTNSAAVLPTTTLNEVIKKARTIGGLIAHCRQFNIPTNISVPIGTPSSKASWHTEGAKVDSESLGTASVSFGSYEIIKIFSISASAKKMTVQAFESYLIDELTACVMETIADSLVNGTGVNQGTGLETGITWTTANKVEFTTSVAYTDFTDALAILKRGYSAGAKFVMNNATLYSQVYGLVDTNGRPIFIADPKNESIGYILGKEVVIDDNIADDTIILGNFNYMGYNIPEGLMIETSRESSFKNGLIDYRAMAIADTKPLITEAFVKITKKTA